MADIQTFIKHIRFVNEQHKAYGALLYLANVAEKHIEKKLQAFDLPVNEFRILRGLRMVHPQGVPVYKLREFLIDQKPDISRLVNRIVIRGLVKRKKDENNKSIRQVILTTKGMTLVDKINSQMEDLFSPMMCLSDDEAKQLNHLFGRVLDSFVLEQNKTSSEKAPFAQPENLHVKMN